MSLTKKIKGTGMVFAGIGGIALNEICGAIHDEPQTTHEMNKLPKGYLTKGLGYILGNKNLVIKGRNYINEYHLKQKNKSGVITV